MVQVLELLFFTEPPVGCIDWDLRFRESRFDPSGFLAKKSLPLPETIDNSSFEIVCKNTNESNEKAHNCYIEFRIV